MVTLIRKVDVNWVVPKSLLEGIVCDFFLKTPWYKRFLIEYLQFKKAKILAGLSKTAVHYEYKKAMQYILETKPPEKCFPCHHEAADAKNTGALCYFRIWMRRYLSNFVQKGEEIKQFYCRNEIY